MPTRITTKGQVTLPKQVREVLHLAPGDGVEFTANERGEIVITRQLAPRAEAPARKLRIAAQVRRRAAELVALLRGLD